jgi:hypothetical protein
MPREIPILAPGSVSISLPFILPGEIKRYEYDGSLHCLEPDSIMALCKTTVFLLLRSLADLMPCDINETNHFDTHFTAILSQ